MGKQKTQITERSQDGALLMKLQSMTSNVKWRYLHAIASSTDS